MESATGPNPAKRDRMSFSSILEGRRSASIVFSVRMAAMMSRAFAFSPLAVTEFEVSNVCSEEPAGVDVLAITG